LYEKFFLFPFLWVSDVKQNVILISTYRKKSQRLCVILPAPTGSELATSLSRCLLSGKNLLMTPVILSEAKNLSLYVILREPKNLIKVLTVYLRDPSLRSG